MHDLDLLAQGSPTELAKRYPDLRDVPSGERGALVAQKIGSDIVLRTPPGIWLGLVLMLSMFGVIGMGGSCIAGHLLRQRQPAVAVVGPYLEIVVPSLLVLISLMVVIRFGIFGVAEQAGAAELDPAAIAQREFLAMAWPYFNWQALGLKVILMGLALVGVLRGWPWPLRVVMYGAWAILFVRVADGRLPWYVDAAAFALLVVLLALYADRNGMRRGERMGGQVA
jgi:hypothetical protein